MKPQPTSKVPRKYSAEFKAEAVRLVASGRRVAEVAAQLGIGENLLYKWRNDEKTAVTESVVNDEVDALRRQIRQLEQERDILKKALLIFSQKT